VGRCNCEHAHSHAHVGKRSIQDLQMHKREEIRTLREERELEREYTYPERERRERGF
jgi:hypothetical protein